MAYTLVQYQTITDAIAAGAKKVKYGDKEVEYTTVSEMIRVKTIMKNELFPAQNTNNGRRFASFSKGT
jgi:hypothetical protein